MNLNRYFTATCIALVVSLSMAANAAESKPAAGKKTDKESAKEKPKQPEGIEVSPQLLEFGEFREGQLRRREIRITNLTDKEVALGRLYSPCPCFTLSATEKKIAPKQRLKPMLGGKAQRGSPAQVRIQQLLCSFLVHRRHACPGTVQHQGHLAGQNRLSCHLGFSNSQDRLDTSPMGCA